MRVSVVKESFVGFRGIFLYMINIKEHILSLYIERELYVYFYKKIKILTSETYKTLKHNLSLLLMPYFIEKKYLKIDN